MLGNPLEIPVSVDTPLYTQRTTLDGREYILAFDWNGRENRWYLSILDVSGEPLANGIKLVANWPLLRRFTDPRLPTGVLMAIDYSPSSGEPPAFGDLGRRVKLSYYPVTA